MNVDVRNLDCDFYAFSGHKMFGPTGIGVLYGRASLLDAMPPYQSGGDMISSVSFARTQFNVLPYKFEAGTPDISGAVGLAAAVEYLDGLGWDAIATHEDDLLAYATRVLAGVPGVRLVGTAAEESGRALLRHRWCASARHRDDPRSRRHCHSRRDTIAASR